jgi:hypothetical protein
MVKKERPRIVNKTVLTKMLPQSYQTCFQHQLKATQYVTLQILVGLLQFYKQVSIELLATLMPEPILFESRRRSLQRFLVVPQLNIKSLWFPVVKHFLRSHFKKTCPLTLAIDRTQWRNRNLFVVSLIWDQRAIPIYWLILSKQGASNLREQQALLKPVFQLLKNYKIILLGDREFGSVGLANWLKHKGVYFCLRQKQGQYIQQSGSEFKRLESLGLSPGISCYLEDVKVTKQKGFNHFNIAAKWKRGYRQAAPKEGWYILTNLESEKAAVKAYKSRGGIEAMFKDCKTGGYNLEGTHASEERLINLVLLIAIAYICAVIQGREIKQKKVQKYVGRVKEYRRRYRRHSTFWVGLYGELWLSSLDLCPDLVAQLMRLKPNKREHFQRGQRAAKLIQSTL